AAGPEVLNLGYQLRVGIAIGDDGREPLDLLARLEHGLVRARQIFKVRDHVLNAILDQEWLQHMGAYEVGEVADRLHGNGLLEAVERLLAVDAEAAAKRGAVRGKALE